MNLKTGQKLGPYEIVALVGEGGMGQVYRARDTRLARTVALKVLPPTLTTPTARVRFEREARAIAALSHPNICAIHDVGSEDGIEYLVMEYLEGETLADRLARGPLPVPHVVRYGAQIADALRQAHRAGITHRDLKPGNVMITDAGAKLLDFGLAKSIQEENASIGPDTPTEAAPLTREGTIVGTVQYMAPEQVEGKSLDHRTDIFALGVTLYEMTTGRRPFVASTKSGIAAAILASDPPPLRSLQPDAPTALERIIATALEKKPDDRWQTAQDVARQLRWLSESSAVEQEAVRPRRRGLLPVAVAAVLLAVGGGWAAWRFAPRPRLKNGETTRLDLAMPAGVVAHRGFDTNAFALAPDGRTLCFSASSGGERALYVRALGSYELRKVEGSENGGGPFWSPDGEWIAFSAKGKLWKTRRTGDAPPTALCDVAIGGAVGAWGRGFIYFADAPDGRDELFRVDEAGGAPVVVARPSASQWRLTWPAVLPDGEHLVYHAFSRGGIGRELILASFDGANKKVLMKDVSDVSVSGSDELMFVRDGRLLAQRYDLARGTMIGDPVAVASDVAYFYPTARAEFDAAPAGVVVYRTETRRDRMSVIDREGNEKQFLDGDRWLFDFSLAPDGNRAAVTVIDRGTGLGDIWIYDLVRNLRDRFTSDAGMEFAPLWAPDAGSLYYSSAQGGAVPNIVRRHINGSGLETVTETGEFRYATSISPDGADLYVVERKARTKTDLGRLTGGKLQMLLATPFSEQDPAVSPDGNWLAFMSDVTGRREIYVQDVRTPNAPRIRVSSDGGFNPQWRADSAELFYVAEDGRALVLARSASGRWDDATAEALFGTKASVVDFAPRPDGTTFVVLESIPGARDGMFHVIVGWH